jgi:hypothetical protein
LRLDTWIRKSRRNRIVHPGFSPLPCSATPKTIEHPGLGDHRQPRLRIATTGVETTSLPPGLEKDVVNDVLDFGRIAEDPLRYRPHVGRVVGIECLERFSLDRHRTASCN